MNSLKNSGRNVVVVDMRDFGPQPNLLSAVLSSLKNMSPQGYWERVLRMIDATGLSKHFFGNYFLLVKLVEASAVGDRPDSQKMSSILSSLITLRGHVTLVIDEANMAFSSDDAFAHLAVFAKLTKQQRQV